MTIFKFKKINEKYNRNIYDKYIKTEKKNREFTKNQCKSLND